MAKIISTEKRICPFCAFEYTRNIYPTNRGRGSICPNCHKRSDRASSGGGQWKAPKIKECAVLDCDETFYANGSQKYCLNCAYEVNLKNVKEAVKRFRARAKMGKQNES